MHTIVRVKQDIWGTSQFENTPVRQTLPAFYAAEPLLVIGEVSDQHQRLLLVLKFSPERPYIASIDPRDVMGGDKVVFDESLDTNEETIHAVRGIEIAQLITARKDMSELPDEELKALLDYCRDIIVACLNTASARDVVYVPNPRETMNRFPDPVMSQQIHKYESYPLLDSRADNYIIDCRSVPSCQALSEYFAPSMLYISPTTLFNTLLSSESYQYKDAGKIPASARMHITFTNTEELFCQEDDLDQAVSCLIDSLYACAEAWPNNLPFHNDIESAEFKSMFFFVSRSKAIDAVERNLLDRNARTLSAQDLFGYVI